MKCSFNGIIRGAKNTVLLMTFISLVLEDFISTNFMNISSVYILCHSNVTFFEQKAEQFKASDVPEIQQLSKAHLSSLQNKKRRQGKK